MTNPLMDLIGSGEGDYNSYNRGTIEEENGKDKILPSNQKVDFSKTTVEEIRRRQALPISDPDRMLAVGRYQFITKTLDGALTRLEIQDSELFTPELQDRLFNEYLLPRKRRDVHDYIVEKEGSSLRDAQKAICKEWASVEDPDNLGHVYAPYEKHGNKMHTTTAQVAVVLDEMRAEYKKQIERGMSPTDAWAATTTMGPGQNAPALRAHSVHASKGHTLRKGGHGPAVGELQTSLHRLGYAGGDGRMLSPDNHFGENTRRAVEAFQRDHALVADGVAGPATLAAVSQAVRTELRSIGQPDAPYLRTEDSREVLPAYRTLAPEPELTTPVMPVVGRAPQEPKVDAPQGAATGHPDTDATRTLQQNLNTLGATDMRGDPLAADGIYGIATQTAVARFQSGHGLPVTGQADEATRSMVQGQAFIAELQQTAPTVAMATPAVEATQYPVSEHASPQPATESHSFRPSEQSQVTHTLNDPRHPDSPTHRLYNELEQCIPGASENRLLQFTAACHMNMITADNLSTVHVDEERMTIDFRGTGPLSTPAQVDLSVPPPKPQEAIQQIQQFDQQEMQLAQAFQTQSAQVSQSGPRL